MLLDFEFSDSAHFCRYAEVSGIASESLSAQSGAQRKQVQAGSAATYICLRLVYDRWLTKAATYRHHLPIRSLISLSTSTIHQLKFSDPVPLPCLVNSRILFRLWVRPISKFDAYMYPVSMLDKCGKKRPISSQSIGGVLMSS